MGFVDQIAIFTVTGIFFPIASIGLYLLCRLHLNKIISLFAAFLFISFSLNILWTANGSLDIPAIAISIWIIYLSVLATDQDPKYFLLVFPLFVIGFFTRYTVGFIFPLIMLYILFKIDFFDKIKLIFNKKSFINYINNLIHSKSFNYIAKGTFLAIGIFMIIISALLLLGSDLTFINQTQDVISGGKGSSIDPGFKTEPLFYLSNLPNFISSTKISFDGPIPVLQDPSLLSYFIIILIIFGFLLYLFKIFRKFMKNRNKNNKLVEKVVNQKTSKSIWCVKIIGVAILSIVLVATYKEVSSIISEILFFINILLIFNILNKYSLKELNFNLLMISWFMVYLIFFSYGDVKVDRYFITILPVIAYFAAYSLNFILNEITKIKFMKNNLFIKLVVPISLIILFAMSTFAHIETIPIENSATQDPIKASEWLMNYDPDYDSKVIWTHNIRYYTWYLKTDVVGAYEKDLHKLEKNNVSYLIFNENKLIENYTLIKKYENVYIYKKDY
jgi:hypothetical protein